MLSTLDSYIKEREQEWDLEQEMCHGSISFEDETLIYCIQDWFSMRGEFTEEEYQYLKEAWNLTKDDIDFFVNHELDTGCTIENGDEEE